MSSSVEKATRTVLGLRTTSAPCLGVLQGLFFPADRYALARGPIVLRPHQRSQCVERVYEVPVTANLLPHESRSSLKAG